MVGELDGRRGQAMRAISLYIPECDVFTTTCTRCVFCVICMQGFGGMGQPFLRRYVVSQAVQIMETAVVNNTTALATFRELDAAEVSTCDVLSFAANEWEPTV